MGTVKAKPINKYKTWYQLYEDVFDNENVIHQNKILADHRSYIRLHKQNILTVDKKIPNVTDPEVEWLPRKLIGPLQEEFQAKIN